MKVKCDYCGKIFERRKSHVESAAHNYCSRECAAKGRGIIYKGKNNPNWRGGTEVPCTYCGKNIWVRPYDLKGKTNHFCSRECMGKWEHENIKGENHPSWKGGNVKKICEVCGKEFEVTPASAEITRYCSRSCASKAHGEEIQEENNPNWKGGPIECICKTCEKHFFVCPAQIKEGSGIFCSVECYGKWRSVNIRGENHPQWNGGISFEPYCVKFDDELKERVREKYGRVCFLCAMTEKENGRKLSVHHVNYNKKMGCDGTKWLLVPLCVGCNSRVNFDRDYWEAIIRMKMKKRKLEHGQTILDVFF